MEMIDSFLKQQLKSVVTVITVQVSKLRSLKASHLGDNKILTILIFVPLKFGHFKEITRKYLNSCPTGRGCGSWLVVGVILVSFSTPALAPSLGCGSWVVVDICCGTPLCNIRISDHASYTP